MQSASPKPFPPIPRSTDEIRKEIYSRVFAATYQSGAQKDRDAEVESKFITGCVDTYKSVAEYQQATKTIQEILKNLIFWQLKRDRIIQGIIDLGEEYIFSRNREAEQEEQTSFSTAPAMKAASPAPTGKETKAVSENEPAKPTKSVDSTAASLAPAVPSTGEPPSSRTDTSSTKKPSFPEAIMAIPPEKKLSPTKRKKSRAKKPAKRQVEIRSPAQKPTEVRAVLMAPPVITATSGSTSLVAAILASPTSLPPSSEGTSSFTRPSGAAAGSCPALNEPKDGLPSPAKKTASSSPKGDALSAEGKTMLAPATPKKREEKLEKEEKKPDSGTIFSHLQPQQLVSRKDLLAIVNGFNTEKRFRKIGLKTLLKTLKNIPAPGIIVYPAPTLQSKEEDVYLWIAHTQMLVLQSIRTTNPDKDLPADAVNRMGVLVERINFYNIPNTIFRHSSYGAIVAAINSIAAPYISARRHTRAPSLSTLRPTTAPPLFWAQAAEKELPHAAKVQALRHLKASVKTIESRGAAPITDIDGFIQELKHLLTTAPADKTVSDEVAMTEANASEMLRKAKRLIENDVSSRRAIFMAETPNKTSEDYIYPYPILLEIVRRTAAAVAPTPFKGEAVPPKPKTAPPGPGRSLSRSLSRLIPFSRSR